MSRTDKDRPQWVKRNDPTLLHYTDHNHLILGKVFYKKVLLRDANGHLLTEEVTGTQTVFREGAAKKAGFYDDHRCDLTNVFDEAEYEARYKHLWRIEEYTYLDYVSKLVPRVAYANHCTEGELLKNDKDIKPCTTQLTIEGLRQGWVDTDARQMYHGAERRRKRDTLKRYAKEANTYGWEDLDDDDAPDILRRHLLWH